MWTFASIAAAVLMSTVEATSLRMQGLTTGFRDRFDWMIVHMAPAWFIFVALLWVVRWIVRRWPVDGPRRAVAVTVHTLAAVVFPIVHISVLSVLKLIDGELMTVRSVATLTAYYYVRGVVLYVLAAAFFHAIDASQRARARAIAQAKLEVSLAQARLETLRAQLSPHFLFNVLNTVGMLMRAGDTDAASEMLHQFSGLLRGFLRKRRSEFVSLEEEGSFAQQYLDIQRSRYPGRLQVSIEISDAARTALVPTFVLYPLIENAIKHGVGRRSMEGLISVRASLSGDSVILEVEDDGAGLSSAGNGANGSSGIGLANLRARLANLYDVGASLSVNDRTPRGVLARVEIPFSPQVAAEV